MCSPEGTVNVYVLEYNRFQIKCVLYLKVNCQIRKKQELSLRWKVLELTV
jgi:hypothetical protein